MRGFLRSSMKMNYRNCFDSLGQVIGWLQQAAAIDTQLKPICEGIESLSFQLEEIVREIRSYRDNLELNPGA